MASTRKQKFNFATASNAFEKLYVKSKPLMSYRDENSSSLSTLRPYILLRNKEREIELIIKICNMIEYQTEALLQKSIVFHGFNLSFNLINLISYNHGVKCEMRSSIYM